MRLAFVSLAMLACGCPSKNTGTPRVGPAPTVNDIVNKLSSRRATLASFTGSSLMDYWINNQRVKGDVLVMGKPGAMVRFAALSPAGGSTIVDMACDGTNFAYVDQQNNCQLTGPCDRTSIAQMLHIELEPEDFVQLALGTPPVPSTATGTVTWDASHAIDRVELNVPAGRLQLAIDTKDGRLDVIEAKQLDQAGKVMWAVENRDFSEIADTNGVKFRVPLKTKLVSPTQGADLLVEWKEREYNVQLPPDKFQMQVPQGLAQCGAQKTAQPAVQLPPPPPAAPAPATTKP